MRLGIIGAGVVGGSLGRYFTKLGHEVLYDDPPKNLNDDLRDCKAIFIAVPIPTLRDRSQDLSIVKERVLKWKVAQCPFFMKSTVLPGTCDRLSAKTKKTIVSMPEFLTERFADQDMDHHEILCGDGVSKDLVKEIFLNKRIHFMKNSECEMAKYAHNCFAAMKIMYFNVIKDACNKLNLTYENVVQGSLISGFIEKSHTQVPGPDGKRGYGGKCLPKDLAAFIGFLSMYQVHSAILKKVEIENQLVRG